MVMEYWSITLDYAIASGSIKPLRRNASLVVSHLLFADDMLVFCKCDKLSASGISEALKRLHLFTGLEINKQKNKIFFSKGCKHKVEIADI